MTETFKSFRTHVAAQPHSPSLERLLASAQAVATEYEAQQAKANLSNRFGELLGSATRPLRVALLALDETSAATALNILIGTDSGHHLCRVAAHQPGGLVELQLQSHGFVLDDGRERREFATLADFLSALQNAELRAQQSIEEIAGPLRLGLAAPSRRLGLHLFLPESIEALEKNTRVSALLADQADFVLLAGRLDSALSTDQAAALQGLLSAVPALQCLVINGNGIRPPWTQSLRAALNLPVLPVADQPNVPAPETLLAEDKPAARQIVQDYQRAREASRLIELLQQELKDSIEEVQRQRRDMETRAAAFNQPDRAAGEIKELSDESLVLLAEEITLLQRSRDDLSRDAVLPRGSYHELIRRKAEQLSDTDFRFEDDQKITRISLKEESLTAVQQSIVRRLFADFEAEAALVNEAVETTAAEAARLLARVAPQSTPLRVPRYDAGRLLDYTHTVCTAPLQHTAELQRVTRGQFVWQTIQHPVMVLFTLMMPMSLFMSSENLGPILRNLRFDIAVWALAPLYIATPFLLYRKNKTDRRLALVREVDRMRSVVQNELDRAVRSSLDEKKRLLSDFLRAALDDLRRQLSDRFARAQREREQRRAQERQEVAADIQRLDQRLRELGSRITQCDSLRRESETLRRTLENAWNPFS